MDTRYLILQTGQVFPATAFGSTATVTGELVFTTSMIGYLETLTDPGYYGQLVVQTFPLIGNYGVITEDFESNAPPALSAYIVKELCDLPSNFRSTDTLMQYFKETGVIGLYGLDTRAITKILREEGAINAAIVKEVPTDIERFLSELKQERTTGGVAEVTCQKSYVLNPKGHTHVVLWDFGVKKSICEGLTERGCKVTVVPAQTTAEEILALHPQGILLSNGPGDPLEHPAILGQLALLTKKSIPLFGIGLGHLLLALSQGGTHIKMKCGHHGGSQPVRQEATNRLYMTAQGHNYVIPTEALPKDAILTYSHVDDLSCEGLAYPNIPAFSVQFHPEGASGSRDTNFLFDEFLQLMGGK